MRTDVCRKTAMMVIIIHTAFLERKRFVLVRSDSWQIALIIYLWLGFCSFLKASVRFDNGHMSRLRRGNACIPHALRGLPVLSKLLCSVATNASSGMCHPSNSTDEVHVFSTVTNYYIRGQIAPND